MLAMDNRIIDEGIPEIKLIVGIAVPY